VTAGAVTVGPATGIEIDLKARAGDAKPHTSTDETRRNLALEK
jgi:hypothetical protein